MCDSSISDPMTFLYLDMLSNILIEDAKDSGKEFEIKMNFIREQEQICLENAKQLISVDQFIEAMKECLFQSELELQENEATLLEVEKIIFRYKTSSTDFPKGTDLIRFEPRNYLVFLKLLLSADRSAAQYNKIKEEIELYNNEASEYLKSPKLITKIIDYHVQALNSLEKQLDQLTIAADNVSRSYDEIINKLKIGSLSTKCTCEMAGQIKNI